MYAVIETGGKQYRVEVGTELEVELLDAEPGKTITLDRVLLVADDESADIGRPVVAEATVQAEVVRQARGPKTISFKYRPKARSRVKKGHRQELTVLRISDITHRGKSAAAAVRQAEAAAKTERQRLEEAAAAQAAKDAELAAKLGTGAATSTEASGAKRASGATAKAASAAKTTKTAPAAKATAAKAEPAKPAEKATPAKPAAKAAPAKAEAKPTTAKPAAKPRATKKDE